MKCYQVADTSFSLSTVYEYSHKLLRGYETDRAPEVHISTDQTDLAREYLKMEEYMPGPYVESLAVYRKLCDHLLGKHILLFHGSAIAVDGRAYIFAAPSGTGKSTHARLWRELLGPRAVMINDDKPLIDVDRLLVYGTPWDGKHHLSANICAPLSGIALLSRSARNHIEPLDPLPALPVLLQQAYRSEQVDRILPLVERLADSVPVYRLQCNMEPEAARISWRTMHGGTDHL